MDSNHIEYQGHRIYSTVVKSANKNYGSNNQATFFFNAENILPNKWSEYICQLSFIGDEVTNYDAGSQAWQVSVDIGTRSFSFDNNTQSQSAFIAFVTSNGTTMSCNTSDYSGICIGRPTSNNMTISIRNIAGNLVTATNQTDMNNWIACLTFNPVVSSLIINQRYQDI